VNHDSIPDAVDPIIVIEWLEFRDMLTMSFNFHEKELAKLDPVCRLHLPTYLLLFCPLNSVEGDIHGIFLGVSLAENLDTILVTI
jgi:hypothetical protein